MDLNHLRYFLAIVSAGSLSGAAKDLGLTQPTLTGAMRRLEENLGSTLLLRDHGGVSLTSTGEALRRHAEQVLRLVDEAKVQIRDLERLFEGTFILGCHESLGAYFLPGFLSTFLAAQPRIDLTLWNGNSAAVQQAVVERRVHFGLVVNPRSHPDLVLVPLFHDAMDLFVAVDGTPSAKSKSSAPSTQSAADLAAARQRITTGPLVYASRVSQCRELIDRLAEQDIRPLRQLSCGDLELVKSLALSGVGVALLPRRVAGYGHQGALRRLHPSLPHFPDTICLVYRGDLHRTRAALRVKEALLAHGHKLHQTGDGFEPPSPKPARY